MSFRTRLVLAAAYLVAAVVLALEIPLALSIERRADSDFQTDVLGRAALLAARISDEVAAANQGAPSASTGCADPGGGRRPPRPWTSESW